MANVSEGKKQLEILQRVVKEENVKWLKANGRRANSPKELRGKRGMARPIS
jgi:hypothetical protein